MLDQGTTVAGSATESPPFEGGRVPGGEQPKPSTSPGLAFNVSVGQMADVKRMYERIPDPMAWATLTGQAIAQSGMFGVGTPAAGYIIAMQCYLTNMPIMDWPQMFHVVAGKVTMRSDAMLSRYMQFGGRCEWKKWGNDPTEDRAQAIFTTPDGIKYNLSYTVAEADTAGLTGKDIWRKYRGDMLRARLISRAVRATASYVCAGIYTPEELADSADYEKAVAVFNDKTPQIHVVSPAVAEAVAHLTPAKPVASAAPVAPVVPAPVVEPTPAPVAPVAPQVVAAPVAPAVQSSPVVAAAPAVQAPADPQRTPITRDQAMRIAAAKKALEINDEKWATILAKRNVKSAKELTAEQAHELIEKLAELQRKRIEAAPNPQAEASKQAAGELTAWAEGALTPKPTPSA